MDLRVLFAQQNSKHRPESLLELKGVFKESLDSFYDCLYKTEPQIKQVIM